MLSQTADSLIGTSIGNYEIKELMGQGAMGAVYLGVHPRIGKKVAVKVLALELSQNREISDRFILEAQAINELKHPNIIEVYDFGTLDDGRDYYTMECLEGLSLAETLGTIPLSLGKIKQIVTEMCNALTAVHKHDIVHRDLKPGNIFLNNLPDDRTENGEPGFVVKLLDFGIAKLTRADGDTNLETQTGVVLGTPVYMSPEQAIGKRGTVDHRTDIYAVGVILYKMLSGQLPVVGDTMGEIIQQHITTEPRALSDANPAIPRSIQRVIHNAISKQKEHRFDDAAELRDAFLEACEGLDDQLVLFRPGEGIPRGMSHTALGSVSAVSAGTESATKAMKANELTANLSHTEEVELSMAQTRLADGTVPPELDNTSSHRRPRKKRERRKPDTRVITPATKKTERSPLRLIVIPVVLLVASGAWWFLAGPGAHNNAPKTPHSAPVEQVSSIAPATAPMQPPVMQPAIMKPAPISTMTVPPTVVAPVATHTLSLFATIEGVQITVARDGAKSYTAPLPHIIRASTGAALTLTYSCKGYKTKTEKRIINGDSVQKVLLDKLPSPKSHGKQPHKKRSDMDLGDDLFPGQ